MPQSQRSDPAVDAAVRASFFAQQWFDLGAMPSARLEAYRRLGWLRMVRKSGLTQAYICRRMTHAVQASEAQSGP